MCRGGEEGRKVGAAWLGGAQSPPRVLLSETGKRGAGTEPRPFPSRHCMNQGEKREGRKVGLISLPPTPPPPSSSSSSRSPAQGCQGGKMAPPAGEGPVPPHSGRRRLHLLCGSRGLPGRGVGPGRSWPPMGSFPRQAVGRFPRQPLGFFPPSSAASSCPPPPLSSAAFSPARLGQVRPGG